MTINLPLKSSAVFSRTWADMLAEVDRILYQTPVEKESRREQNLESCNWLVDHLNLRPAIEKMRIIHVAGTKGKGTTSSFAASFLLQYQKTAGTLPHSAGVAPLREDRPKPLVPPTVGNVGLFTSPHLVDIRERILVNNCMLPRHKFAQYFFELKDQFLALEAKIVDERALHWLQHLHFFRFMTLLCCYIFEQEKVDVAVMETGIGGRLDMTNILHADVSIITSLGLDHTQLLGDTVEKITVEKAGIMKSNPCYAAPQKAHPSTRAVLQACALASKTPLRFLDEIEDQEWSPAAAEEDGSTKMGPRDNRLSPLAVWPQRLAMRGEHVLENAKLGLVAARLVTGIPLSTPLRPDEVDVLSHMTYAGRSQVAVIHDRLTLYLDGAHTPESITKCFQWFHGEFETLLATPSLTGNALPNLSADKPFQLAIIIYCIRDPDVILPAVLQTLRSYSVKGIEDILFFMALRHDPKKKPAIEVPGGITDLDLKHQEAYIQKIQELCPEARCFSLPYLESLTQMEASIRSRLKTAYAPPSEQQNDVPLRDHNLPLHLLITGSFFLVGDINHLLPRSQRPFLKGEGRSMTISDESLDMEADSPMSQGPISL